MNIDKMYSDIVSLGNVIVSIFNTKKKTIELITNLKKENEIIPYQNFAKVIADKYDLVLDFTPKLISFLDNLNPTAEFKVLVEYNCHNNTLKTIEYMGVRESADEILIVVRESDIDNSKSIDELTKAYSKSYIMQQVSQAIGSKTEFALMIVDIDFFKQFNDNYGHMFGDIVLVEAVAACKKILGNKGSIARIGGDEFLIFANVKDDYEIIHDLCSKIKFGMQKISNSSLRNSRITVTIGSSSYPTDGDNFEILFKKADRALYRGKKKGRDCFVMYDPKKCGVVSINDEDLPTGEFDKPSTAKSVYSVLASIIQILNSSSSFDDDIEECLNLIGEFFYIDRICFARLDVKTDKINQKYIWHNPKTVVHHPYFIHDDNVKYWREMMGEKKYVRIADYQPCEEFKLNHEFVDDHTRALFAFELVQDDLIFGLLRFDMTTNRRHWQPEDEQAFLLISKIFTINLNRNYIEAMHYKTLYFDKLTDLYNYNKFYVEASNYIMHHRDLKFSLLEFAVNDHRKLSNIIGVKKFNDILLAFADELKKYDNTIYGRRGDNCFIVFFPHRDKKQIEKLYNNVVAAGNKVLAGVNNDDNNLVVNGGIYFSDFNEDFAHAVEMTILTRIEKKRDARLMYFNDEIYKNSVFNASLLLNLNESLKNNEFLLYLQPKVDPLTNEVVGAEALTRWLYQGKTLLYPDSFIPLFEENGLISLLDYKVFENVCKFQAERISKKGKIVPISVNVSRFVTDFEQYLDIIENIRKNYNVDSKYIEIEITEGMYFSNTKEMSEFIEMLHSKGYRVSMDDFGSGYSNFTSLAKLDFDTIKLDKSFCTDLRNDKERLLVYKIMDLVKSLNMATVCEGVETKDNVDYLISIGCNLIQGYYYDKPIPYHDFEKKYLDK